MTAPIASGWSESPGGPCTHWKAPPFHGARRFRSFAGLRSDRRVRAIAVIRRCGTDGAGREQRGGPCYSRYDRVGRTVRRGSQVSPTPDSTLDDPEQLIADLQRQLAECRAERDEALAQQTATAGYCRSSIARPASSRRRSRRCSTSDTALRRSPWRLLDH
jgi:hypothetical protein